jgi:enoyl-[acyl-carrier protein] reductase III
VTGRFQGKVALVTGGSRGVGRAISLRLAQEGADVIVNYFRRRSAAAETVAELRGLGVRAEECRANLAEVEQIDRLFEYVKSEFGRLDILINNAASGVPRTAMELDARGWEWTLDINARAFLLSAQRAAALMPAGGKMVSISSLGSRLAWPVYTAVGVSKAALEALTRYLAVELAPRGIAVNGIAPAAIESENLARYTEGMDIPKMVTDTPAGRALKEEDVAAVTAFLCSEDAAMIRGQIIVLDGGMSLSMNAPETGGEA